MPTFAHLIKREIVEHRAGMLLTPAIIAGLIALVIAWGALSGTQVIHLELDDVGRAAAISELQSELDMHSDKIEAALGATMAVVATPLLMVSLIVTIFMLLGSLYDERAERTILFWKSMPVSDTMTVLSKLVTGALVIPLAAAVIGAALQIFTMLMAMIFSGINGLPVGAKILTHMPIISVWWSTLMTILFYALWAAPVYGWLMVASAWAPRAPFLVASVPIAAIAIAEALFLESGHFVTEIGQRLSGARVFQTLGDRLRDNVDFDTDFAVEHLRIGLGDVGAMLAQPDLWIGLAVGAALVVAAIYIRRTKAL